MTTSNRGIGVGASDDYAAADPEGAAAVLSGVRSIFAGGASLLSSGVGMLSGTSALPSDSKAAEAVDYDDVDPLLGQALPRSSGSGISVISDEEKFAMEAEEKAKSAAYAAVEAKTNAQKQLYVSATSCLLCFSTICRNLDSILANLVDMGYDPLSASVIYMKSTFCNRRIDS